MRTVGSEGVHTYITKEGDLLLFSKKSGRLYGFDETGSRIYRSLESGEITVVELLEYVKDSPRLESLARSIVRLLRGDEDPETPATDPLPSFPRTVPEPGAASRSEYRLGECCFTCTDSDSRTAENLLNEIAYLKLPKAEKCRAHLHVDIERENEDLWMIRFNGTPIHRSIPEEKLFPYFCDAVRIACYRRSDYLISLHAAVLGSHARTLILPAVSGSGKSTLAAYLMHRGFEFFTDEVALIDRQKRLLPLPFPLAIKEGSWQVLEALGLNLGSLPVHRRFDDQKLLFLPPSGIADTPRQAEGTLLLFPRYQKGASLRLERLTTLETLTMITESGYEVRDSFDETTILSWIRLLESFDRYRLTYGDLREAHTEIERLMGS